MRLVRIRNRMSQIRSQETLPARSSRLSNMRERAAAVRRNETPISREALLNAMREYVTIARESESPSSREARLSALRKHATMMRECESSSSREARLFALREHATNKRECESPSSREARLSALREHAAVMRECESPSSREARLSALREHATNKRECESPSSREARLSALREHATMVREIESPISRDARLAAMREHAKRVRKDESPTSREDRLSKKRKYNVEKRQQLVEDTNFEVQISQVAEIVCYSCDKLLYQKQACRITVLTNITLLPQGHPDEIVCCNRCANYISKNKTPSMAFWNNMSVVPIPTELQCLNEMEIRLVSRIRPFIKVVRLGGKFGQEGFKGQAILFAQQVEEVSEQLPISAANAGLAIVAESLQNVSSSRRYCVDVGKIKKALEWLKHNNHLYACLLYTSRCV